MSKKTLSQRLKAVKQVRHEKKLEYMREYYRTHKDKINGYRADKRHQEHLEEMHERWRESQDEVRTDGELV